MIEYDHINKRLVTELDGEVISIPVTVVGTKHASIDSSDVTKKVNGRIPITEFVKALKKYRNNNGKSYLVTVK